MFFAGYMLIIIFFAKEDTVTNFAVVINGISAAYVTTASKVFPVLTRARAGYFANFTEE